MANYRKSHFVRFGPAIPIVPIGHFSKLPNATLEDAWTIVGPSAERNMRRNFRGQCLEMWQVIACAYLEGLHHGSSLQKEMQNENVVSVNQS